jgi:hydroxypyruvate isomerase
MPRFAANLGWLFTEHPFLERFGAAGAAGFEAVEFASPYEHPAEAIAERLERHGLRCILFNLPMGDKSKGDFGIACRPGREDEFREGVARAVDYAKVLRCRRINCIAGRIFAGEDRADLEARLVSNLRFAARAFATADIELVVEPLNDRDNPDFLVPTSPAMAKIIAAVDEPNVGLQCDIYHTVMMGTTRPARSNRCARSSATSSSPTCPGAASRARAASTCPRSSSYWIGSATTDGFPPNTALRGAPGTPSAGCAGRTSESFRVRKLC